MRPFCPVACAPKNARTYGRRMRFRRKVGVTAAASLDPFDGEDVTSLFTRVRWAEGMISEFRASAAKKHKAVGEFPKVPALAPDLIEAFSQYWKDRTVAQVKFHTVFDLVEACFESTSFPNFKALRSALERLLANMGIKTVRHMCELPLVDSQDKRDDHEDAGDQEPVCEAMQG